MHKSGLRGSQSVPAQKLCYFALCLLAHMGWQHNDDKPVKGSFYRHAELESIAMHDCMFLNATSKKLQQAFHLDLQTTTRLVSYDQKPAQVR